MRVAVTGGTGFVGGHLTRKLLEDGHEVVLISRGRHRPRRRDEKLAFARGDAVTGDGLAEAMAGCDAVINLVAVIHERGSQTFEAVNHLGTRNVVAAARQAGVRHIVQLSAIGADPDPAYPYTASKWAGEQEVKKGGVPYTIIRSSLVFGPGDVFFTRLKKLVKLNPVAPLVGGGIALFQPIHAQDLARCLATALQQPPSHRVLEVGGPDHLSLRDIIGIIRAKTTSVPRPMVSVPVKALLPVAWLMDKVMPNPTVTPGQLRLLEKSNITRLDSVPSVFGFEPRGFAEHCDYLLDY